MSGQTNLMDRGTTHYTGVALHRTLYAAMRRASAMLSAPPDFIG